MLEVRRLGLGLLATVLGFLPLAHAAVTTTRIANYPFVAELSRIVQSPPNLTLAPQSLDFGKQVVRKSSPSRRVTATNSGGETRSIVSVSLTGDNWQDFAIVDDTCSGRSIEPAQGCFVSINFAPGRAGSRHARLTINIAASTIPAKVDLTGSGINSIDVPPFER